MDFNVLALFFTVLHIWTLFIEDYTFQLLYIFWEHSTLGLLKYDYLN